MTAPTSRSSNVGVFSPDIEISPPQRPTIPGAARRVPSFLGDVTIMVDSDNSTRFPGWYADPGSSAMERFWDGRQWTDSTRTAEAASAARADVIVDLTGVEGIEAKAVEDAVSATPAPATRTPVTPAPTPQTFKADSGGEGLFSQPRRKVGEQPGETTQPRVVSERPTAAAKPAGVKPATTPSALTGLFGKPDPANSTKPSPTVVKNPTDTLSPAADVTKEQLESAKAQLESESKTSKSDAAPSLVELLEPKNEPAADERTTRTSPAAANAEPKSAPTAAKRPAVKTPKVTKAQASKQATSFPKPVKTPTTADAPRSGATAKATTEIRTTTPPLKTSPANTSPAKTSPVKTSPAPTTTNTDLDGDAKKPWAVFALLAGLLLAGGGFLLGFLAGGSDSDNTSVDAAPTTEAPVTTIAQTEAVETTVDAAMEEAMLEAETRVEELEAESATAAEQIASLEADAEMLAAERDNEIAHNELLQSWFTADVLARSQGNWDFEVGRACALEAEPTVDDLNYSRRLEVVGTPADLLAAVQECRG